MTMYLDHHATTPASPAVIEAVTRAMRLAGNASSSHEGGKEAARVVEAARQCVAETMGVDPAGVCFTSGATEANNAAIQGVVALANQRGQRPHIVTTAIEHSAILAPLRDLVRCGRATVTVVAVGPSGIVDPGVIARAMRPDTALVSVQGANNEIGTIQPIEAIARVTAGRALLHSDLCQSFGKVAHPPVFDLASVSAHKLYGPTGVGALYIRPGVELAPLLVGGSQEGGRRGGTLNLHGIAGFGAACDGMRDWPTESQRLRAMRDGILRVLSEGLGDGMRVNGSLVARLPQNLNVTFLGVCPFSLDRLLRPHMDVSAAAACKSLGGERSHVLLAIGAPDDGAVMRMGLGRSNTPDDAQRAARLILDAVRSLQGAGCEEPATCEGGACALNNRPRRT